MTGRGVRVLAQMIAVVVAVAMVGAPSLYAGTTVPAPSANDRSFFSTPRGSAEQGAAIAPSTLDAPLPPHLVPIAQLGGNVTSVVADMNLAYVGVGPRVVALDLSDPLAPVELGRSEPLGGVVQDLCLAQDVLYVAAEDDGVHVISLFSQALLGGLAHIETSQAARCLELLGDWLYVAEGDGLRVLDVRDPSRPLDAGHRAAGDDLHDLVAVGDTLYAAGDSGLVILDVGDPRVPTVLARVTTTHPARSVAVQGGLALVGEGAVDRVGVTGQLHAVDIQKPAEPIELGACTVGGLAHDILFYLDHALVAHAQRHVYALKGIT